MTLFTAILVAYAISAVVFGGLNSAYGWQGIDRYMISDDPHRSTSERELYWRVALNGATSVTFVSLVTYFLGDSLVYRRPIPLWRHVLEGVTAVMVYDFAYYFMHRYPFHEWKLLRGMHSIHHAARNPRVFDSLLLHPLETVLGLGLLFASLAVVGGVHVHTFTAMFIAYTVFNILNHCGIAVPYFPFKALGYFATIHDRHHHSMLSGNYASITPLPDIIFGTAE